MFHHRTDRSLTPRPAGPGQPRGTWTNPLQHRRPGTLGIDAHRARFVHLVANVATGPARLGPVGRALPLTDAWASAGHRCLDADIFGMTLARV